MGGPAIVNDKNIPELDNFFVCKFELDDRIWPTTENYFQAQKSPNNFYQEALTKCPPKVAWKAGNTVEIRDNWEDIKVEVMYDANYAKFSQNPELKEILLSTAPHEIKFTASTPFWNEKNAEILTKIREELKD